eukprot:Gb_21675 [translate_table: standard]
MSLLGMQASEKLHLLLPPPFFFMESLASKFCAPVEPPAARPTDLVGHFKVSSQESSRGLSSPNYIIKTLNMEHGDLSPIVRRHAIFGRGLCNG